MPQTDLMNFFLQNYIDTIYGGKSQQTSDIFNNLTANGTENALGGGLQNSDMLSGVLQRIIAGEANPISQSMQSKVNRNFDRNIRGINENLAATGMSRSGAGSAIQAQAAGEAAGQVADAEAQLYNQAILQLLGIDQLNLSERAQDINFMQSLMQGKANKDQQNLQEEANDFNFFRDFFPGLLQGGAQVGAAALTGGASIPFTAGAGFLGNMVGGPYPTKNPNPSLGTGWY